MDYMPWFECVELLEPHIVRIRTPQGSGTGFLVSHSEHASICAVATANHVIDHAHFWEQPIRLDHAAGQSLLLRPSDRAIFPDQERDTAGIVFEKGEFPLPGQPFQLAPQGKALKVGAEVAWLGFPALAPGGDLCFFSGRISAHRAANKEYLVDGVAINGVSGGPAFFNGHGTKGNVTLIGVVSAYIPNRATGQALPGVAVVSDVGQFHGLTQIFKSIDEAKEKEVTPDKPAEEPGGGDSKLD